MTQFDEIRDRAVAFVEASTVELAELADAGEFEAPCHDLCDGMIRYPVADRVLSGTCPLMGTDPPCIIPGRERRDVDRAMAAYGWPAEYLAAEWDRCDPAARGLLRAVPLSRGVIVLGPIGTGKTSATALLARDRWRHYPTRFLSWTELLDNLRGDVYRDALRAPALVLDDFGVGEVATWQAGKLDRLFERRYSRRLVTSITTNLLWDDIKAEPAYARFVDRWRRMMHRPIVIGGESKR